MRAFLKLSLPLQAYICAVVVAGVVLLGTQLPSGPMPTRWWIESALLVALGTLVALGRLKMPFSSQWMSFDLAVIGLAQLEAGQLTAILCAGAGAIASSFKAAGKDPTTRRTRTVTPYKLVFNFGACALSAGIAGFSFQWVHSQLTSLGPQAVVASTAVWSGVYFLVNSFVVAIAAATAQQTSVRQFWRANSLLLWPSYVASGALAALVHTLWHSFGLFALLPLPLTYFIYKAYQEHLARAQMGQEHIEELNRLIESLMTSLAMAVEAKDVYTRQHIQRVQYYSVSLAEAANLDPADREAVRLGALVHDVGKIAIPDRILAKPGKLSQEEFQRMKEHVVVGSTILEPVGFSCPVAEAVRSHHERWDGLGYPDGLRGDQIPVGGRVIAIADVFDALTSSRPYRRAMKPEDALEQLRRLAGSQLDPELVELFIKIYPEIARRMPYRSTSMEVEKSASAITEMFQSQMAAAAAEDVTAAFELMETLLTTPGDDLARRALEQLQRIIPSITAVLYEVTPSREELVATTVVGEYQEQLTGMVIRWGEGVSGRAALTRTPFVNAHAMADVARVFDPGEHIDLSAALCVPVVLHEETVAVITLYHSSYEIYKPHHRSVLITIAEYLATAMDLRRRFAQDRDFTLTDPTTGLYNVRYLVDFLSKRAAEEVPEDHPLALLLVDLDQLGGINERFGRTAGDQILGAAARKLEECAGKEARVCRYGGDEFVVVLEGAGKEEADRVATRIRRAIQELALPDESPVTCGVGAAVFPGDVASLRSLIAYADLQMYQDKMRARKPSRGPSLRLELPAERNPDGTGERGS